MKNNQPRDTRTNTEILREISQAHARRANRYRDSRAGVKIETDRALKEHYRQAAAEGRYRNNPGGPRDGGCPLGGIRVVRFVL
mgnify:CR=1 FL=1|jgi:hypothetical protein